MSSESKHELIDRLNRTGRFANQPDGAKNFKRPLPVDARLARPGVFDPMQKPDAKNPVITFTPPQMQLPFRAMFSQLPTKALYEILDCLQEVLGSRTDAKR